MNLTDLLDGAVGRWSGKTALIERGESLSYEGLHARVEELADRLRTLDLRPGSLVGLHYPNGIAYVALTFALWRIQAVVVPIPVEFTKDEISTLAETLHLEWIIGSTAVGNGVAHPELGFVTRLRPVSPAPALPPNLAFIRFTSGTTRDRKGVALGHDSIWERVKAANKAFAIGPQDTIMWCLPMSHHFLITIVLYLTQGATTVLTTFLLAKTYLREVNRHRATVLYATPYQYSLMAAAREPAGIPSVRLAVSTTCGLSREVATGFYGVYEKPLTQALGIIELGLVSLNQDDPVRRWNSVGRPLPDHEVRILHPDGEGRGEISIRGPGFLDAYAAPWMQREEIMPDGWFQTGDIGRIDEDGYLFLLGRSTSVINLAGRKVFPEEIEEVLNRHSGVRESRVYGRSHPHLGEVVEAEVVLTEPGDDSVIPSIRAYCREHLAAYKIPTRLQVVSGLPRTPVTGKIMRVPVVA